MRDKGLNFDILIPCKTCGTMFWSRLYGILNGNGRYCGRTCYEIASGNRLRTHGMTRAPEYGVWRDMLQRCTNPKCRAYRIYGARGITVCERWKSFENFFADMRNRPTSKHQIERKDNDGNYEPSNCKWATKKEQANNRRTNRNLTLSGKTMCVKEWSKLIGVTEKTIRRRLKGGWSVEETLEKA